MAFHKLFIAQVVQTVDLFGVYLCLLLPVFLVKGLMDRLTLGQFFWGDYGWSFLVALGGFIGLFIIIDLLEAGWGYFHGED